MKKKTIKIVRETSHPGHKLWEFEVSTRLISESDPAEKEKPGHLYVYALNWTNADKKFHKMLGLKYKK